MTTPQTPKLGERVFVWPRLRTVRDAHRQPVKNEDGSIKQVPAYVRGSNGMRITDRMFVTVDLHILKMMLGGNLEWCSREEQRAYLAEQLQPKLTPEPVVEATAPARKKDSKKTQDDFLQTHSFD